MPAIVLALSTTFSSADLTLNMRSMMLSMLLTEPSIVKLRLTIEAIPLVLATTLTFGKLSRYKSNCKKELSWLGILPGISIAVTVSLTPSQSTFASKSST